MYIVKWPFFHLQSGSAKSPIAPSNFSPLWIFPHCFWQNVIRKTSLCNALSILHWSLDLKYIGKKFFQTFDNVFHTYFEALYHTGIFAKNSLQIDSMNSCSISKQLLFWLKIVKIIHFLTLKPIRGTLGFILKMLKKIARWRHKSEISKRNVKTMMSPLLLHL